MNHIKLFEYYKTTKTDNINYVVTKTGEIVGYNLKDGDELNSVRYDKDGKSLNYTIGWQRDKEGNYILFDSLEDAQNWEDERRRKNKNRNLKKIPKTPLGKKLYEISEYVKKKYPNINRGTCYFFTYLISKYFPIDEFVMIKSELDDEPIHMMCKIGKMYYDGEGFHYIKDILNDYSEENYYRDDIVPIDKKEMEYWNDIMDYDYVNGALTTMPLTPNERNSLAYYIRTNSNF